MAKLIKGVNDLATLRPDLAKEWDYEKNDGLDPSDVTYGSGKKIWWKCSKGHSYESQINNRVERGQGCPYCSGHQVLVGFNDLATIYPELAVEWDYDKNKHLVDGHGRDISMPTEVASVSSQKVWWKCKYGHSWLARISDRVKSSTGCPKCKQYISISFPEQACFYYVSSVLSDAVNGCKDIIGMELDIYVPSLQIGIEYDGFQFHSKSENINRDLKKNKLCNKANIRLVRIREDGLCGYDDCECLFRVDNRSSASLNNVIFSLLHILGFDDIDVNVDRDRLLILENYRSHSVHTISLQDVSPELAEEWDFSKNLSIKPSDVTPFTHDKYWWICPLGHSYKSSVSDRSNGCGCPVCAGKQVLVGYNDLLTTNPALAVEWNYDKNVLTPQMILEHSSKRVWWKCEKGHEWQAPVCDRSQGKGCPYCSNRKVLFGFNDLATVAPDIAEEWDYERNSMSPSEIIFGSPKSVWWKCKNGHSWKVSVVNRYRTKSKCPYCNLKKVLNVDTGELFEGISAASVATGLAKTTISNACCGRRSTAGGYHWKYVDAEDQL